MFYPLREAQLQLPLYSSSVSVEQNFVEFEPLLGRKLARTANPASQTSSYVQLRLKEAGLQIYEILQIAECQNWRISEPAVFITFAIDNHKNCLF